MTDLFLIAHKVRGEPAFDVATQMECPHCKGGHDQCYDDASGLFGCIECDSLGYWWIIPTSGHRAYPYWTVDLAECLNEAGAHFVPAMPEGLPDHYTTRATPTISLSTALGLDKPKAPSTPIVRRF